MPREVTEIVIDEEGTESHESWLKIVAHKYTGYKRLFDSEITHQHYVGVSIHRCTRKRQLHNDFIYPGKLLLEFQMSHAQWGAFVSSFGDGGGVPATLDFIWNFGLVPTAPEESRLAKTYEEVQKSAEEGMSRVSEAARKLSEAFDRKAGRNEMRDLIRNLQSATNNVPGNMKFAAKSMTEHVEEIVTKAQSDIEAMVADYASQIGIEAPDLANNVFALMPGESDEAV